MRRWVVAVAAAGVVVGLAGCSSSSSAPPHTAPTGTARAQAAMAYCEQAWGPGGASPDPAAPAYGCMLGYLDGLDGADLERALAAAAVVVPGEQGTTWRAAFRDGYSAASSS